MRVTLQRLTPVLRLTRLTNAFAAIANAWFVVLWTRSGDRPEATRDPIAIDLLAAASAAAGLYAFGSCVNDVLDARRDRALNRDRPIGTGLATEETAVIVAAVTLIIAVLGATHFGTGAVLATLALSAAILVFNAAGRFVPGIGLLLLAGIFGGQMMVPNLLVDFLWPVWLVGTHALLVSGVVYHLSRLQPRLTRRSVMFALSGWLIGTAMLLAVVWVRDDITIWPDDVPADTIVWPVLAVALFAVLVARRLRSLGPTPRASEKIARYGALWMSLYGVAWLAGAGRTTYALWMGGLALAGFAGMSLLRELYGLVEHPVDYRR